MNKKTHPPMGCGADQRGAMLIEVLITMFVVSVGLLGAAGLQLASTRFQQTSTMRSQALIQADFIIEKMRVNNSVLTAGNLVTVNATPEKGYLAADDYATADTIPDDPNCGLTGLPVCTAGDAAQRDLREWKVSLARDLPGGRGAIFPVTSAGATEPIARRVVVMWREKAQMETDVQANQADPQDATCPAPLVDGVRCLNLWVTP